MKSGYRFFDHTADFGLEIFGVDEKDLFIQAAGALTELIADPGTLQGRDPQIVAVEGDDWADLMVNWLRELLYLWNGRERLVGNVELLTLEQSRLQAKVFTDAYDSEVHAVRNEIKAVTYHQIEVGPCPSGWRARVIFDI